MVNTQIFIKSIVGAHMFSAGGPSGNQNSGCVTITCPETTTVGVNL